MALLWLSHYSKATVDHEVACIDINPIGDDKDKTSLCAIGLWTDISVQLLTLPDFEKICSQPLGGGEAYTVHHSFDI